MLGHDPRRLGEPVRGRRLLDGVGLAWFHRREARTIALDARIIEVARRLIDARLAAVRRIDGLHRQTVADPSAVAAALTDALVYEYPLDRRCPFTPLTGSTQLGRALLVVDQHGDARDLGQALLRFDDPGAVPYFDAAWQRDFAILPWVFGGDKYLLYALKQHYLGYFGHGDGSLRVLSSGHCHSAVVEQLVRDVDARSHRKADGQMTGMKEGAVAQVLDEMGTGHERCHADPCGPFGAHGRDAGYFADAVLVHERDHPVATDPTADERPFGHLRAPVVRAARTEEGRSLGREGEWERALGRQRRQSLRAELLEQARTERSYDHVGVKRAMGLQQLGPRRIGLAGHLRLIRTAVERVFHEPFEGRVLLLDHEYFAQALGEATHEVAIERNGQTELDESDAGAGDGVFIIEAEQPQRLNGLVVSVAAGHDPQPGVGWIDRDPVEAVGDAVAAGEFETHVAELALDLDGERRDQSA